MAKGGSHKKKEEDGAEKKRWHTEKEKGGTQKKRKVAQSLHVLRPFFLSGFPSFLLVGDLWRQNRSQVRLLMPPGHRGL